MRERTSFVLYQGHLEAVAMSMVRTRSVKIIIVLLFFAVTLHHFGPDRERLIYHVYVRWQVLPNIGIKSVNHRCGIVQDLIWE